MGLYLLPTNGTSCFPFLSRTCPYHAVWCMTLHVFSLLMNILFCQRVMHNVIDRLEDRDWQQMPSTPLVLSTLPSWLGRVPEQGMYRLPFWSLAVTRDWCWSWPCGFDCQILQADKLPSFAWTWLRDVESLIRRDSLRCVLFVYRAGSRIIWHNNPSDSHL